MMTLYHAPQSRSSAIMALVHELGDPPDLRVVPVTIRRGDGSGEPDPRNPHPEKKVPYLVDGDEELRERGAIIVYLTERYPSAIAPLAGQPGRGAFLRWLFWYQGVFEPVMIFSGAGLSHPWLTSTFRGPDEAIAEVEAALNAHPYLTGDSYTAADLLVSGAFAFFSQMIPDKGPIRGWVERCQDRDSVRRAMSEEIV